MIARKIERNKDGTVHRDAFKESTMRALKVLIGCELKFGGNITDASETMLKVETKCFGCHDTSIFEGSVEEMRPLIDAARFYLQACQRDEQVLKHVCSDAVSGPYNGNPRLLDLGGPMLIGENRVKLAYLLALRVSEDEIDERMKMRLDDLEAVMALMADMKMSFHDVIAATTMPAATTDATAVAAAS
jgi:hypothetical protein